MVETALATMWWMIGLTAAVVVLLLIGRRNERSIERDCQVLLTPDGLAKYHEIEAATQAALARLDAEPLPGGLVLTEAQFAELRAVFRRLSLTEAQVAELDAEFRALGLTEAEIAKLHRAGRRFFFRRW